MHRLDRVDVVLPFVDGSTEGFRDAYRKVVGTDPVPCQVRSLDEVRYALRSIDTHLPWAAKVHLVVRDGSQVPDWIEPGSVEVVLHSDFLPAEVGDCFSPFPLQAWTSSIPGLSDHYVLWSDDKFVLKPTEVSDFFHADGRPRIPLYAARPFDDWDTDTPFMKRVANGFDALGEFARSQQLDRGEGLPFASHMPFGIEKTRWQRFLEDLLAFEGFRETVLSGVRDPAEGGDRRMVVNELWPAWLWLTDTSRTERAWWETPGGRARRWLQQKGILPRGLLKVGIHNDPSLTRRALDRIRASRPWFVCINDDAYDEYVDPDGVEWGTGFEIHPESLGLLREFLEGCFPRPSRFERSGS